MAAMKLKKMRSGMKKKSAMKSGMKRRKAMKKSVIARGKRSKSSVFRGTKVRTSGGLKKTDLIKSKTGKVVSKKRSAHAKVMWKKRGLDKWINAVQKARKDLKIKGFCAVGGSKPAGKALLAKARSYYKK